ncbi:MAG TPA: damage-control phosphatase ARMT1 family protein [Polyangiaceae bacterium]|nr:damage-control phosphatase ARMT1 family protein [Polyangiaceae bacterium]
MHEPAHYPGRIRTDTTNPFAHHTMRVRVPAILRGVLERNDGYEPRVVRAVEELAAALESDARLPPLDGETPGAGDVRRALGERGGETWLGTDWFFAETYAYRQLVERVGFWDTLRDPFAPNKREEYASEQHAAAFEGALAGSLARDERLAQLFLGGVFGNRIDLSFAASRAHGLDAAESDLLVDERERAVRCFFDGTGPLHLIADNAGTELTLDLVLADFVLSELAVPVVLHLKEHPTFVSDATTDDVRSFLGLAGGALEVPRSEATRRCVARLAAAVTRGDLTLEAHPYWNGPASLWELPAALASELARARLVVLKGDANYRRAVGDAVWPAETPFADVAAYFPAPLLALRTLKSDPIVGLAPGRAAALDHEDATWRVNGKRGVASFGAGARGVRR